MKKLMRISTIIILNLVLLCLFVLGAYGAIIIDHNCRDIDKIPESWINQVKNMFLINTGGSHGLQVPRGLEELEIIDATYGVEVTTGDYPSGTNVFKVSRGLLTQYGSWTYAITDSLFWSTETGLNNVRRTLNYYAANGIEVDAILFTWCWHFQTWTEAQVNAYFDAFETLEAEYPGVTFIYMTDTETGRGDMGYNRWLRNEQVRRYCRENNKVLFDFGELETWSADGTAQNTFNYGGQPIPVFHPDWTPSSSDHPTYGHINRAGAIMKAKAMWWLMARLAGWDGDGDNQPPVANAGPDQTVIDNDRNGSEEVTLDGSASSDPDGTIVSFVWREGGAQIATGVNPTVILSLGTHIITLTVTDNGGLADTDTVTITVSSPGNQRPVANAGPDQTVIDSDRNGSEEVTLDGSASYDPDGNIVSFVWTEDGQQIATDVKPTVTLSTGTHIITLTVTDNGGLTGTDTVTITVSSPANQPPVANAGPDQTVVDNDRDGSEQVTLDGSGSSDPDGTIVSFIWREGGTQIATGVKPTVTLSLETHTITLTVTDNGGLSHSDTVAIKVLKGHKKFGELPTGCYNNVINPLKGEEATIVVELEEPGHIKIDLYDIRGNKIKELANEEKDPDVYEYYWDGKDYLGNVVGSGLYFVHIQAGNDRNIKKILVIK